VHDGARLDDLALVYALLGPAIFIALLGIGNTLALSSSGLASSDCCPRSG